MNKYYEEKLQALGEQNTKQPERSESEFERILSALKNEVSTTGELSNNIDMRTQKICMRLAKPEGNDTAGEKVSSGIVDDIWGQIYRLRNINGTLSESKDHLNSLVGD